MSWEEHVTRKVENRGVHRVLVENLRQRYPLGRPRCRWKGNIEMDIQEIGCEGMEWIDLAQDRDR
jgi:hypothetical protein